MVGWWRGSATASELGDRGAFPADRDGRATLLADHVEDHFLDQRADELFAVAVGGARRSPHAAEVGGERQQLLTFGRREGARALALAQGQLGLGLGEHAERLFAVALQAAGDEPVLGLDWR